MVTQRKNASSKIPIDRKLHSIPLLPSGREFVGKIEIGKASYQFTFAPMTATSVNGKLVLSGAVKVKSPGGQQRQTDGVTATLLATQGSIIGPPPLPRRFSESLKPPLPEPSGSLPLTDWTGHLGSLAVMYLKLSPLNGRSLGVLADLSSLQLNARLYPTSEIERDLQWLYSALVEALQGEYPNDRLATDYLGAINGILKG